jgi:hypothetical protein
VHAPARACTRLHAPARGYERLRVAGGGSIRLLSRSSALKKLKCVAHHDSRCCKGPRNE